MNLAISASLLLAVFLWGGNNTGTKFLVKSWPPIWTGGSRFFCAGLLLWALLRWTPWFGKPKPVGRDLSRGLWVRGGLSLALYIVVFNTALRYTSASHVALYLGASPVWALLWEQRPGLNRLAVKRYAAAFLALAGVVILFLPALRHGRSTWWGEALGLAASVLWTNYGRQCRRFASKLSGAETSAHTMWRAGLLLLPLAFFEVVGAKGIPFTWDLLLVQLYCILAGGVAAFAIWNSALKHWPASQVLLFNNLIPLSTMTWAHFWLKETILPTFWLAMLLVAGGVFIGQASFEKLNWFKWLPPE